MAPVHLPYDSRNTSTSNLEHLQQFDANGIIVHPCKLLIIIHGCYTLRRPIIAILALVQFFKIQVAPVHLPYDSRNTSTSNLEHLQHFDANGIIVYPCKLLIIVHGCYILRRPIIAILVLVQFFKIQVAPVSLPYDSRNTSTSFSTNHRKTKSKKMSTPPVPFANNKCYGSKSSVFGPRNKK